MKKSLFSAFAILLCGGLSAARLDIVPTELRSYKVGEPVTFTVAALDNKNQQMNAGSVTIAVRDSGSGGKKIMDDVVIDFAKNNPATFTAKLSRPGFILAIPSPGKTADGKTFRWDNKPQPSLGGAAVEPEKLQPGAECPADFDEFWRKSLDEFKKAEVVLADAPAQKRPGYKVSRITVKFPDGSGAIDGFLSIPEKPGKYPAIAGVPGAGPGTVRSAGHISTGKPAIELWLNVHTFPTADHAAEQKKRFAEYNAKFPGKAYYRHQADNRDRYIYRKVWSALSRAIDYVAALPEFDGKHFAVSGGSQGGGTALAVGALNPRVSCIMASVPAMCDHGGWKLDRQAGWPQLHNALKGKADNTSGYFDAANFAARIKVPTLISAGYVDLVCSPSSVYAAYNRIKAEKKLVPLYRAGHTTHADYVAEAKKFLTEQFGK